MIQEELALGKARETSGVVRVRIETEEHAQPVELEQWHEHYEIERVPVGEAVATRNPPWQDGEVWVIPVYEERAVVRREWVLKEEIRLRKHRTREVGQAEVLLRKEHAHIEREAPRSDDETRGTPPSGPAVRS